MGQISIILIAGLIFLFSFEPPPDSGEINQLLIIMATVAVTVLPAIFVYFLGAYVTRTLPFNPDDRVRRVYLLKQGAIVFEVMILIGYVCDVYLLRLPVWIHQKLQAFDFTYTRQIFSIVPLIVGLMLIRLALYEIEQKVGIERGKRREVLGLHLKFLLLPLFPLLAYFVIVDVIWHLPMVAKVFFSKHQSLLIGLMACLILLAYIYAPLLLRFIWRTTPLTDTNLRERLHRLATRDKIKYKSIVVWQTGSLAIANAAVAGLIPWSRQIFLTDALLKYFSDDEIETVVAHEFGHLRYKHIPTYLIFSLTYFLSYALLYLYIGQPIGRLLPESPIISSIGTILLFVFYFVLVFRYLSRRFEHQADLYAVELTGKPEAFKSALSRLAYLNYVPRSIQRLLELFHTHPSISRRIEFIDRLQANHPHALRYQRYLLEVKIMLLLLPVLACILFFSDLSRLG